MDKAIVDSSVKTIDDTTSDTSMSVENATTIAVASSNATSSVDSSKNGITPSSESAPSLSHQKEGGSVKNFLQSAKEKWNNVPQGWMQSRKKDS